jgi:hypothetical protein
MPAEQRTLPMEALHHFSHTSWAVEPNTCSVRRNADITDKSIHAVLTKRRTAQRARFKKFHLRGNPRKVLTECGPSDIVSRITLFSYLDVRHVAATAVAVVRVKACLRRFKIACCATGKYFVQSPVLLVKRSMSSIDFHLIFTRSRCSSIIFSRGDDGQVWVDCRRCGPPDAGSCCGQ